MAQHCGPQESLNLAYISSTQPAGASHRRRRSSTPFVRTPDISLTAADGSDHHPGASSGLPASGFTQPLSAIPGTPAAEMSLSRSPSPQRGGGWSSPGLTAPYDSMSGRSTPRRAYREYPFNVNGGTSHRDVTWASAKAKSEEVNAGYPKFSTRNDSFLSRNARNISQYLLSFWKGSKDYAEKEKVQRGRSCAGRPGRVCAQVSRILWRLRLKLLLVLVFVVATIMFYVTRKSSKP